MSELAERPCIPRERGFPALEGAALAGLLKELGGNWKVVAGHHLSKTLAFDNFSAALDYVNRVGKIAEKEHHHPELFLRWGQVRIEIWTHTIDGLSESDFVLAAKVDALDSLIAAAASEIIEGRLDDQFPLSLWQTGSGTQTNMNVNEGQSTNDTFPTAMAIAGVTLLEERLLPELRKLLDALRAKAEAWKEIVKIGRTHLMDAIPLTLGQALSAMVQQLDNGYRGIEASLPHLRELAIGGTAVGTGYNAPLEWSERMTEVINELTGRAFVPAPNKFEALAAHDALVATHGALRSLACALMKIANDIRWLASGPSCGIGELVLPANEPGSSIMPGKVNPTQCEAMTMVCAEVMGNDTTISVAGASGNFELNVYKPVMIYTLLQSTRLLADACASFNMHCIAGLQSDEECIGQLLERSLMLVTALAPKLGFDMAAKVAEMAHKENITLREAALAMRVVSAEEFDATVRPREMVTG